MANFNKVLLLGNLTRDVEIRYTQGGLAVAKVGMAINRNYTSNGEKKEETCFVDLTAFGRQAETLNQYVSKGSPLFVEGRLEYSTWEAKDGGGKRSKLAVVIENFQFIGSRASGSSSQGGGQQGQQGQQGGAQEAAADVDYGDIPF